ncbi:MAG TPA: ATP-binding protein [Polyangia bacterium]|nr:ATP-binding protein [Polyangia bacterium]
MPDTVPRSRAIMWLRASLGALVAVGIRPGVDESLAKRIRLTNGLSLFGAVVLFASAPFDALEAPRWVVMVDLLGGVAYVCFPLLNGFGFLTGSRLLCLLVSNLIVLGNDVLLGHDSGAELVFVALAAVPFAVFDLQEWGALLAGIVFALAGFAVGHTRVLRRVYAPPEGFLAAHYYVYSAFVAFLIVIYTLYRLSRANTEAERALREDVRERLAAQQELERSRQSAAYAAKMAALGEMSGNVAHEVNNPLAAIMLRAHRLRTLVRQTPLDVQGVERVSGDIETTVHRIRRIVDGLRTFARDAEHDPLRPESVARIVADTIEICSERFRHHSIDLRVDPIPPDLMAVCRSVQISQILLNLLSNAFDAVENQSLRWVRMRADGDHQHVRIYVVDSGPGVPPDLESRIMEPFFTTKDVGKGTGLGLSVSKGIAEAHGGSLTLDRASLDTCFVLTLRRAPAAEAGAVAEAGSAAGSGANEAGVPKDRDRRIL